MVPSPFSSVMVVDGVMVRATDSAIGGTQVIAADVRVVAYVPARAVHSQKNVMM
jgi:hypothetical protein